MVINAVKDIHAYTNKLLNEIQLFEEMTNNTTNIKDSSSFPITLTLITSSFSSGSSMTNSKLVPSVNP